MALMMDGVPDSEAFVTFGRGILKVFNGEKNFGFISPVFKGDDSEGPPLPSSCDEGLWFFGNHRLPSKATPGIELTFEIWENAQGKAQASGVAVAAEPTINVTEAQAAEKEKRAQMPKLHPNEPRVIYPSVYVSDVPVEWNEAGIKKLHRQLGLNPDTIMGLKFLPFTEVSLGLAGTKGEKQATPVTGAVILRYINEEAANASVERLKGHPIQTSTGVTKHLGAKHATPPKWVMQRRQLEDEQKKHTTSAGESIQQKVQGLVVRVAMSGYGVIKSPEWGEVLWRQYELPTNLRTLQFTNKAKFMQEVEHREDFRRLKEMAGKEVDAELYKLPDGQLRASHVRVIHQGGELGDGMDPNAMPSTVPPEEEIGMPPGNFDPPEDNRPYESGDRPYQGSPYGQPSMPPGMPGMPPGMGTGPGMPGLPPGMDPFQAQMMMMQMMGVAPKEKKKKDKKDKKEKKEKKEKKRERVSSGDEEPEEPPKKRKIDDNDF